MGIPVRVANVPMAALDECRGVFLTNVRMGVLPATRINGRDLATSDQARALAARVASLEN